jgi:putative endonuclease
MPEPAFLSKTYYVYILASARNGTLYVGVSNDLKHRIGQHRAGLADSFTKKYKVTMLAYFESTTSIAAAVAREKQLKAGSRTKKLALIESQNPGWKDLYSNL